jgi:endogenous inhibitor of DNA gyrase (YacG/DUF329 family)
MKAQAFLRVNRTAPCPICGKSDWCLRHREDTVAICARIPSPRLVGTKGAGWLHRLDSERGSHGTPGCRPLMYCTPEPRKPDFAALAAQCARALSPTGIQRLASDLDVSIASLAALGVGWYAPAQCYSFPMRNADDVVVGIRLRHPRGKKWAVRGSKSALFIPRGRTPQDQPLWIAEGPTDCAALIDLGFWAVGRPACRSGKEDVIDLVRRRAPETVVIMADADPAGRSGASDLARALVLQAPAIHVLVPPSGCKDVRDWKIQGATAADLRHRLAHSDQIRMQVSLGREASP